MVYHDTHGDIPDGFEIHHVNGTRTDNRIENLQLVDRIEHRRLHAAERKSEIPLKVRRRPAQESRRERLLADPSLVKHGTENAYKHWGCRCDPCRLVANKKTQERRARRRSAA